MALAVTHVIGTILILDLLRHYVFGLKRFPRYLVVVGGIAGLAPDMDIPLSGLLSFLRGTPIDLHGQFTHSLFFVALFLVFGGLLWKENRKWSKISWVVSGGWFLHLVMDCVFHGNPSYLWPLAVNTTNFCPHWGLTGYDVSVDALLLVLWLVHEEVHKKIKDYI